MRFTRTMAVVAAGALAVPAAGQQWTPLFDGKTLNGWEVCNGFAKYRVENGTIAGTTAEGSPNSFLCTTKEYGDFELELETRTDPALNSGIQIRSHRYRSEETVRTFTGKEFRQRKHPAGRVYGYQVEVSVAARGASGGIYDEARRGWISDVASIPECAKAFKDNQWNHYRIAAVGDRIRTWVNGAACADLTDSMDLSGFIALQVHAFKGPKPAEVAWRNLRIKDLGRHEWKPLFDGQSLSGWKHTGGGGFSVVGGAIKANSLPDDPRTGMLLSEASFKDVTARVRFKIVKGNSGVFLRTDPATMAAYEVEVDAEKRTGGLWETGPNGRKWVAGPEDNAAVLKDEWNEMWASLHGRRIVFHINGVKTLDLPNDTQGRLEGVIGLQTHGAKRPTEVWFKDIAVLAPVR